MKFSPSHEWIKVNGNIGVIGITVYAQKELGEVVYVELPKKGAFLQMGEEACVLESTKAAADVYSPISGKVIEVNSAVKENLDLLNQSPEDKGWLFQIEIQDVNELNHLLDSKSYEELVQ